MKGLKSFNKMEQNEKANILLIGSKIAAGGAEHTLLNLAQWLSDHGCNTTAAFFHDPSGLYEQWRQTYPFAIICLHAWQKSNPFLINIFNLIKSWISLVKWMRQKKFTAILSFTHDSNTLALPAAWLAGIPTRYGSHHGRFSSKTSFRYWLHSQIINSSICSGIVAVSSHIHRQAINEGIRPERITTIFNGIDVTQLVPKHTKELKREILGQNSGPLILTIGRLVIEKDHKTLIYAADIVIKRHHHAVFAIVGDGELKSNLLALIKSLNIQNNIRLFGYRTDIPDFLDAADLFVLSSISEGLPISLLQAMGAGKAVVSTRIGGVEDVLSHGVNGLLVPASDPHALAEAISNLIESKQKREELAAHAKLTIINHFSLDQMGRQYLNLLVK